MPLQLVPQDVSSDLEDVRSVLIVSCPVCPPVSLAVQTDSPFIELFKSGLKTPAFENHIEQIRKPLEARGIRTGVFTSYLPLPTMCLWTQGQRSRLLEFARNYEAVMVLGCESATYTAQQALANTSCRVVQAMQTTGITNAAVKYRFPLTIELDAMARIQEGELGTTETKQPSV